MGSWVETATAGSDLGDARLNRRLDVMLAAMAERSCLGFDWNSVGVVSG